MSRRQSSGEDDLVSSGDESDGGFREYHQKNASFDSTGNRSAVFQQKEPLQSSDTSKRRIPPETKLSLLEEKNQIPQELEVKSTPWSCKTAKQKFFHISLCIGKALALLALLYMFVCSLDLLSLGFRLVGGRTAGEIFRRSELLQNPVVGVTIGILTTVLVQSSSTSTSIIVSMVAANFLDVRVAIPIIMGANIGTSITNTIVSFSQAGDSENFRRAFAGATILDMFNWITVIVLLLVEVITGYLYHLSGAIMRGVMPDTQTGGQIELLSVITKPFVNLIVQLDKDVLECWSTVNCTDADNASLIRKYCSERPIYVEIEVVRIARNGQYFPAEFLRKDSTLSRKCDFLFAWTPLSDGAAGAIILILSLLTLCACLIFIVKVLNSVLQGHMASVIKRTLNANIPYVPWLTGYIAILIGAFMTFLVQSSSVFTSALTPLVGMGMISLERVYPLTLGSNLGTTTTGLIASMAVDGDSFFASMQIALCHFLFNMTGILLFYPIPITRIPIKMAKYMGDQTAKYRWFAILYMVVMFVLLPLVIIGLSLLGFVYVIVVLSLVGVLLLFIGIVNFIRWKRPGILPTFLQSWKWLPLPLRSLQPYDSFCVKLYCCRKREAEKEKADLEENENSRESEALVPDNDTEYTNKKDRRLSTLV